MEINMHPQQHRVTFLMLTYNQANLVHASAMACLAQEGEPMEIIFSDDASSDNTYDVLKEISENYQGPHALKIMRNERNLGVGGHLNKLIALSQGDFLIASAGDDISFKNRAQQLIAAWDRSGQKADLVTSHCVRMLYDGTPAEYISTAQLDDVTAAQWTHSRPHVIGATHAFTRRLHEHFGPFIEGVGREDQIITFRAVCLGTAMTLSQPYVYYRDGGISRRPGELRGKAHADWIRKNNRLDIAELTQVIQDAVHAGRQDLVNDPLQGRLDRAMFIEDIFQHEKISGLLMMAFKHSSLSWGWRLKKMVAISFADQYSVFQEYNRARRLRRRQLSAR